MLDLILNKNFANAKNYGAKRSVSVIKYIVMHYTGNDGDTDEGNGKYFAREAVGASAHYFVDEDSATQSVQDEYVAWHCQTPGMAFKCDCRNSNSLGVEMCSDVVNGKYVITEKTKQNAAKLVRWLMNKYNVPLERVIRHYDVCGKNCPEPWVRDLNEWKDFKKILMEAKDMEDLTKLRERVEALENSKEKVYNSVEDVPEWGRKTVEKLIEKGYIKGTDTGLCIGETLLRVLVINDRAGVYG